jgi:DNA replication protein DnaC
MRKLPASAAEDLLEIIMRRYERTSTIITSNRPLEGRVARGDFTLALSQNRT